MVQRQQQSPGLYHSPGGAAGTLTVISPVRVGGGYLYEPDGLGTPAERLDKVTMDTLSLLPQDSAYSMEDFAVLSEIIQGAERETTGRKITLTKLLKSYDLTLRRHGINAEKDTHLYRFILKLSLDPNPNWWAKFHEECELCALELKRTATKKAKAVRKGTISPQQEGLLTSVFGQWREDAIGSEEPRNTSTPPPSTSQKKKSPPPVSSIANKWRAKAQESKASREQKQKEESERKKVSSVASYWMKTTRESKALRKEQETQKKVSTLASRWRTKVSENKAVRRERAVLEKWEEAVDFARKKKLRQVFHAWYLHDMVLLSKAMNLMRSSTLRYHFNVWVHVVHKYEDLCYRTIEARNQKCAAMVFKEWLKITKMAQMDKIASLKAITYWSYNKIHKCMSLWMVTVQQKKKDLMQSRSIYAASLQIRSLIAWRKQSIIGRKARKVHSLHIRCLETKLFRKWRARYHESVERKHAIYKCLVKMRSYKMKSYLRAWKTEAEYKNMIRDTQNLGILRVQAVKVLFTFSAWKAWYSERMELQGKLLAVGEILRYRRQAAAWNGWLMHHNAKIEKEEMFLSCLSFMLNQKIGRIMESWHAYAERKKHLCTIKETLVKRIRNFNLYVAFSEWLGMIHMRKDKLTRCMKALQKRKLLYSFNGFCYVVSELKIKRLKVKMSLKKLRKRELAAAMNSWIDYTARNKYIQEVIEESLVRTKLGMKVRAFKIWRSEATRVKRMKTKIAKAAHFLIDRRLAHHFKRWKDLWISKLKEKLSWLESRELIEKQRISRLFHKWILKKRKKDYVRKVLIHWKKALLSKCLTSWSSWSKKCAIKKQLMQTLITKLKGNRVSHAFYAWVAYVRIKSRHRQIIVSWRNKRLLLCFLSWKDKMLQTRYQSEQLQFFVTKWMNDCLSSAFAGWVEGVVDLKQRKELARRALTFWIKQHMLKAFRVLRRNASERKLMKKAVEHLALSSLYKGLYAWLYIIDRKKELSEKALQVIKNIKSYSQRCAFKSWTMYLDQLHQKRSMIGNALLYWKLSIVRKGFASWTYAVEDKRTKLHNAGVVLAFWKSRSKLMALRSWKDVVEYRLYLQDIVRRCVMKIRHRCKHKSWLRWLDYVSYKQRKGGNLMRALAFWKKQQIRLFYFWRQYVKMRITNDMKIVMNLKRLYFKLMYDAFLFWDFWTCEQQSKKRKARLSIQYMSNRKLAMGFNSWRELVPWMVSKRRKLRAAIGHWSLRIRIVFYLNWYDYTQTMKVARINRRRFYLSKAMKAWVYVCQRNMQLANLLEIALMRWAYREIVTAWEKLKENARNSKLKRKAISHFCESRRAMAYWRWVEYVSESKQMKMEMEKAIKFWQNTFLASAFVGWHATFVFLRHQREVLSRAIKKWQTAQCAYYFNFWSSFAKDRREIRIHAILTLKSLQVAKAFKSWFDFARWQPAIRKAIKCWRNQALAKAFAKWNSYTEYRKMKRLSITFHRNSCRTKVINAWMDYTERKIRRRDNYGRALSLFHKGMYAKAFYVWKDRAKKLILDRSRIMRCLAKMQKNVKMACLELWLDYLHRKRQKQRAIAHACRVTKQSRLRMWLSNAAFLKKKRNQYLRLQHRVISRMNRICQHKAFDTWSEFVYKSKTIRRILYRVQKRKMLQAYNSWLYFRNQQCKLRYAMARSFRKMLLRSFLAWFDYVTEKNKELYILQRRLMRKHELVLSIIKRWTHLELALPWTSWQRYIMTKAYSRYAIKRASCFRLSLIINHWFKRMQDSKHLRQILEAFAVRTSLMKARGVLKEWKSFCDDNISRRTMILQKYLLAMQVETMTKVLYALKSWTNLKKEKKRKMLYAVQYFISVSLCKAFATWRDEVNMVIQLREIYLERQLAIRKAVQAGEAKIRRKRWELTAATFMAWRLHTGLYKRLRLYVEYTSMRKLSTSFDFWRNSIILSIRQKEVLGRLLQQKFSTEIYLLSRIYFGRWATSSQLRKQEERLVATAIHHNTIRLKTAVLQQWKLSMITADPLSAIKTPTKKFVGNATPEHVMQSVRSLSDLVDRPHRERLEPFLQLTHRWQGRRESSSTPGSDGNNKFDSEDEVSSFPVLNMQNMSMYKTPVMTRFKTPAAAASTRKSSVRSAKMYFMQDNDNEYYYI